MKKIFQKNQVILTALAIMIAIAGYMNFTKDNVDLNEQAVNGNANENAQNEDEEIIDEDVLFDISQEDVLKENIEATGTKTESEEEKAENEETESSGETTKDSEDKVVSSDKKNSGIGEVILVNNIIQPDSIYSAKINREQERAKNKSTLLSVVENESSTQEMKDKALNEILEISSIAEKELAAESLLEAKGYTNCIVSISDESTDVIVDVETITQEDATTIMDVVKRKTGTQSNKIVISPVNSKTDSQS